MKARQRRVGYLQTDPASRAAFSKWLRAVQAGLRQTTSMANPDDMGPYAPHAEQAELAEAIGVSDRYIRAFLTGAKGPSPEMAWTVGEGVATRPGRQWCSGLIALAAIPCYRMHVLGIVGTLLATNKPSPTIKRMWPVLRLLCTNPAAFSMPVWGLTWTDAQRDMIRVAYRQWDPRRRDTSAMNPLIAAAIKTEESTMTNDGPSKAWLLAIVSLHEGLGSWFEHVEHSWPSLKGSF